MKYQRVLTLLSVLIFFMLSCGSGLKVVEIEKRLSLSQDQILIFHHRRDSILTSRSASPRLPSEIIGEEILIINDILRKKQIRKGNKLIRRIQKHEEQ